MFKKAVLMSVVMGCMVVSPSAFAMQEGIVTVDMDKLFNKYYKTNLADAQLKEQADEFGEEREALIEKYNGQQELFQQVREDAQNMAMMEEVRNSKRDQAEEMLLDIREQEQKIRRMEQQRRKQLEEQQQRMRKRIVNEISEIIETYAREQNYLMVIDSSGQSLNGVSVLLYAAPKLDITDELLEMLNKGAE